MKTSLLALLGASLLVGCAAPKQPPATAAVQAACVKSADTAYKNSTLNLAARPLQEGLRYGAPTMVFQSEEMGAMNQRAMQIRRCEDIGNQNGTPAVNGVQVVTPHIVN